MKVRGHLGLVMFLVLCRLASARQLAVQRFIEEPRSVSVREGETVVLACSVDNKMGVLQWTKGPSSCISDKMTQNGNKISHS